jgi:hypothetical protein
MSSDLGSLALNSDPQSPFAGYNLVAYQSSKTALNAVTVAYAKELRDTGIKVNAANPGFTATDLNGHRGYRTPSQGAVIAVGLATGVRTRHFASSGEPTSYLAAEAGRQAITSAGISEMDAVVLATTTPDWPCPATAPRVAELLGLTGRPAFDVSAVCTGFLYAISAAPGLIVSGAADSILVIGAETFSTILDPQDRSTRMVFGDGDGDGDGAGAVVLCAGDSGEPGAIGRVVLGSDGSPSCVSASRPQLGSPFPGTRLALPFACDASLPLPGTRPRLCPRSARLYGNSTLGGN